MNIKPPYPNGMTVKQLKQMLAAWPDETIDGEPTEVWFSTGMTLSSPCVEIGSVSGRHLLLTPSNYYDGNFSDG